MSFQLRHADYGVYQGSFLGMGFWHPMSNQPEQGFCEFPTERDIREFIDFLVNEAETKMDRSKLSVEPFDKETSDRLIAEIPTAGFAPAEQEQS